MNELNVVTGITVGQYGTDIKLQVSDNDAVAVDISGYTGITVYLRDPFTLKLLTYTGSFVNTGTDGLIKFTPTAATEIDRPGVWEGQVKLTATSVVAFTSLFKVTVQKAIA